MKFLRLFIAFLIGMVITGFLISSGMSRWLVFLIVIITYLAIMVLPGMHVVYFSNSLRRIERYIKRNRFKAIFAYPYALGHGSDEDVETAIEHILATHKQEPIQSVYRTVLAIHRGYPGIAAQHAEGIDREPLHSYYMAQAAAAAGNLEHAAELNQRISEPWMKHAIEALIAYEQNDDSFSSLAAQSVDSARGIQKYTLEKSFARMKPPIT